MPTAETSLDLHRIPRDRAPLPVGVATPLPDAATLAAALVRLIEALDRDAAAVEGTVYSTFRRREIAALREELAAIRALIAPERRGASGV